MSLEQPTSAVCVLGTETQLDVYRLEGVLLGGWGARAIVLNELGFAHIPPALAWALGMGKWEH